MPSVTRSDYSSTASRIRIENDGILHREKQLFDAERVNSLKELREKLLETTLPEGYCVIDCADCSTFMFIPSIAAEGTVPELLSAVRVWNNLRVEAFHKSVSVHRSVYEHLLSTQDFITSITELTNVLASIKSLSEGCLSNTANYVKVAYDLL